MIENILEVNVEMRRWKGILLAVTAGIVLVSVFRCTWNPFGEEDITAGYRQVSGEVRLHDGSSPEGVYVWLEVFKLGTKTDETGHFTLTLPPKSSQTSTSGLSGFFNLYFYIANYLLDSSQVGIVEGEFVYDKADINKEGKLYAPKMMRRFLRIETLAEPTSVFANYTGNIEVKVTLTATIDSVTVVVPKSIGGMLGAVLLKRSGSENVYIFNSAPLIESREKFLVGKTLRTIGMSFNLLQTPLGVGTYEVIPYLLMAHEPIPEDLLKSIGPNVEKLGPDYLNIPFRREGGQFEVKGLSKNFNGSSLIGR